MPDITLAIIGLIGIIGVPLLTYFGTVRKLSGKIGTSDASDLWAESKDQRNYLDKQLERANDRILRMEERMAHLEEKNFELRNENATLRIENAELKLQVAGLQKTVDRLQEELDGRTTT
jgi:chromosome segregation ATPase